MEISAQQGFARRYSNKINAVFSRRFQYWVNRRIPPVREIVLNLHNIFILPTRQGLGYCFVLALMFIGAINYETNLAFALVFWLMGVFILSIFYTFRNLAGLHLSALAGNPVFVGENVEINLILSRHGERSYEAVQLGFENSRKIVADLLDVREQRMNVYLPAEKRGYFKPDRLKVETFFPFGLCRAWSLIAFDIQCLVYPKPLPCDMDWMTSSQVQTGNLNISSGNEDFYNLREYQKGDPLKHVAWKNFARGQGMYTKQYSTNMDDRIYLNWDLFPDANLEDKLSKLCYCVIQLHAAGLNYGLDIPACRIEPGAGVQHYHEVLKELALFGKKGKNK